MKEETETPKPNVEVALDDTPPLQGERVAFTGTLASMTHREAFDWVEKHGGTPTHSVSRQTTMLVVGEEGWALEPDGQPSQKLRQVLQWNRVGVSCRIVRESGWLHLIDLDNRRRDMQCEYTPAMLSRLLNVPVNQIRRWTGIGLLRATQSVGRMPLFDYREVTGARRIVELLDAGVEERDLVRGVVRLRAIFPAEASSVSSLPVFMQHAHLLYRDDCGVLEPETGQRCFDFESDADCESTAFDVDDGGNHVLSLANSMNENSDADAHSRWTADDWFREGYQLLEASRFEDSVEAFRIALMGLPNNAEANFYLAEAQYRLGNRLGALERYYSAVENDRNFLEAWMQLGLIHSELDDAESALDAFEIALQIHPENADAHWNKADLLWRLNRKSQSRPHWAEFLEYESESPWAETARERLNELAWDVQRESQTSDI